MIVIFIVQSGRLYVQSTWVELIKIGAEGLVRLKVIRLYVQSTLVELADIRGGEVICLDSKCSPTSDTINIRKQLSIYYVCLFLQLLG